VHIAWDLGCNQHVSNHHEEGDPDRYLSPSAVIITGCCNASCPWPGILSGSCCPYAPLPQQCLVQHQAD
jgi:hypothetical protein